MSGIELLSHLATHVCYIQTELWILMSFFDAFSERARRVVFWANSRAHQEDAAEITAEHILYGLLHEDPQLFAVLAPDNPQLASKIEESLLADGERSKPHAHIGLVPMSELAKEIVRVAEREKERLRHRTVGTQHLLLALLICPEERESFFRRAKSKPIPFAQQVLAKHGVLAKVVEHRTKAGIITPQSAILNDPLFSLNAQLSALAQLLIERGVFTRHEFVALLDQNPEPLTVEVFLTPLVNALAKKGVLTESEKPSFGDKKPLHGPDEKSSN